MENLYASAPDDLLHIQRYLSAHCFGDHLTRTGIDVPTRVKMDRSTIDVDGSEVNLSPGMAVSAEVKTGRRRVIEYFLSPLLQYGHESLKER